MKKTRADQPPGEGDPDVIFDVIFEEGLFYLAVRNISPRPALDVTVKFRKPLPGLGEVTDLSALPLFRHITFLAPQKEIRTLLASSHAWFARRRSSLIETEVTFRDRAGRWFTNSIRHDLRIYQDVAYTLPRANPALHGCR